MPQSTPTQPNRATAATKWKVGLFTFFGITAVGIATVFVNDRPYWWRGCQLVSITIEDATGLKFKSPIRSLGIQIGYLQSVELQETQVRLGICITVPVEVLPTTRAYIKSEGFLGDRYVELKPVKYLGDRKAFRIPSLIPAAQAAPGAAASETNRKEIPVGERSQDMQNLVTEIDELVDEMSSFTTNLKSAINPQELRATMQQLNRTLENASKTLSPEGGLNTTAQRTLSKLEDAIEQMRDQLTRINRGEGSVGKLLNDPVYAEEIREAIRNVNRLLNKVNDVRFVVNMGAETIPALGGRGWFQVELWPKSYRYYLLGVTSDPRGNLSTLNTTVTAGTSSTTVTTQSSELQSILITAMMGRVLWDRVDLSVGLKYGDGLVSIGLFLGGRNFEDQWVLRNDLYFRGQGVGLNDRVTLTWRPLMRSRAMDGLLRPIYLRAGLEGLRTVAGSLPWGVGAGVTFDDDDIKLLFALK